MKAFQKPKKKTKKPKSIALVAGSGGTLQDDKEEQAQGDEREGEFESQLAEVMNLEAAAQLSTTTRRPRFWFS